MHLKRKDESVVRALSFVDVNGHEAHLVEHVQDEIFCSQVDTRMNII